MTRLVITQTSSLTLEHYTELFLAHWQSETCETQNGTQESCSSFEGEEEEGRSFLRNDCRLGVAVLRYRGKHSVAPMLRHGIPHASEKTTPKVLVDRPVESSIGCRSLSWTIVESVEQKVASSISPGNRSLHSIVGEAWVLSCMLNPGQIFLQVSHPNRPAPHPHLTQSYKARYLDKCKSPQSESCTPPP